MGKHEANPFGISPSQDGGWIVTRPIPNQKGYQVVASYQSQDVARYVSMFLNKQVRWEIPNE